MKILIVEDEQKIAKFLKKGLEQSRYAVDVAYDGQEGFDLGMDGAYDLIVLDVMLPQMNGLEVSRRLRQEKVATPILLLTAKGQLQDKLAGFEAGADDYLVKPFAFEELLARIKSLTKRPVEIRQSVLKIADLTIDTDSFEVRRAGKLIKLSKREYNLLEYLLLHKNKIMTKDQIIQHVWEYDSDVLPNTVEVYIGYLRKKIDRNFATSQSLIHTIRGFGYMVGDKHV